MTDQSVPQPPNADPGNVTGTVSGAVPPPVTNVTDQAQAQQPQATPTQPAPPIAETHTTVTLDGVEQTIGEALTLLGTRNSLVQQVEAYIQTYGRDAGDWLHRIVDAVIGALPSS